MKFGVVVVLVALITTVIANQFIEDPGYVLLSLGGHTIRTSVPVLLFAILILFLTLWGLRQLWLAPRRLGQAYGRGRADRAGKKLTAGMIEVAEGNFARGEKMLARSAASSSAPLFNYLQAARAAHLQGRDERRDEWLRLAYDETPEATNAVLLTQAEFQLDRGQYEHALATLRRIEQNSRDHSYASDLLGRLYFELEDWAQLEELLPRLEKQGRAKPEQLHLWRVRVHLEQLKHAGDGDAVVSEWQRVPKKLRTDPQLLDAYYLALIRTGMHAKAEKDLAAALRSNWSGPLVRLYGLVEGTDASQQLKRAEDWLKKHPEDPDLLLTVARLCQRTELWGKARSHVESTLSIRPTPEAYHVYGKLLSQLGEGDAAASAYRDGLDLAATGSGLTAIPHLTQDDS